jgi:uncharacterized protein (TIGR04255 family)
MKWLTTHWMMGMAEPTKDKGIKVANPPINQLMLTVLYEPQSAPLTQIQLFELYDRMRASYPNLEQIQRAGPMPARHDAVQFQIPFGPPRHSLKSEDRQWQILLQEDRLGFAWQRLSKVSEDPNYPGFEVVLDRALQAWENFRDPKFMNEDAAPLVVEVAYIDMFDLSSDNSPKLSQVFNLVNPHFKCLFNQFDFNWMTAFDEGGFTQIQISAPALFEVSGLAPMVALNCTVRLPVSGGWNVVKDHFSRAHDHALEAFSALVKPESQK